MINESVRQLLVEEYQLKHFSIVSEASAVNDPNVIALGHVFDDRPQEYDICRTVQKKLGLFKNVGHYPAKHGELSKATAGVTYLYYGGREHAADSSQFKKRGALELVVQENRRQTLFFLAVLAQEGYGTLVRNLGSVKMVDPHISWSTLCKAFGFRGEDNRNLKGIPSPEDYAEISAIIGTDEDKEKTVDDRDPALRKAIEEFRRVYNLWNNVGDTVELNFTKKRAQKHLQMLEVLASHGYVDYEDDPSMPFYYVVEVKKNADGKSETDY